MGLVPASGDLITVRLVGVLSGQPIINNLSFSIINPASTWADQVLQVVNDMDSALGVVTSGVWMAGRSAEYTLSSVQVVDVVPGTSPMGVAASGAVGSEGAAESLPPNDALAVTFRSDYRGAGGRGRIYLSGYTETWCVGGFWTSDAQDAASAICSALITGFGEGASGANMRWIILHRFSNGGVRGAPEVPLVPPEVKPVMSFTVHNEVRSLGRRAMGRRIHRARAAV